MSDNQELSQAHATLFNELYQPAFFEKLASFGIVPSSQEEAATLLQMGDQLRSIHDSQVSQASTDPLVKLASERLSAFCGNQYPDSIDNTDVQVQHIADELVNHPEFAKAAAIYGKAQLGQIVEALQ